MFMKNSIKNKILLCASFICASGISSCSPSKQKIELVNASISEDSKFKSATIDITITDFNALGFKLGDSCDVSFSNGYKVNDVPYFNGYYVKNGSPVIVAYPSSEYVLFTLNNVGVWDEANLNEECTITITLNEAAKYIATQEALSQTYTLKREECSSDEEFANFRSLKGGNLKENTIYRGASPFDNSRNRAKYADGLLNKNNISTIIDLADTSNEVETFFKEEDFSSTYAKNLYENNKVTCLAMGSGYMLDTYKQKVASGFRFILSNDAPIYIHCLEGKDRTGFVCTLIEALMGATYVEMRDDYMQTYLNYYKINETNAKDKYDAIVSLYFDSFMECLHGSNDLETLKSADYVNDAKNYLKSGGLNEEEINSLINKFTK